MSDSDISVAEHSSGEVSDVQLPLNFIQVGEIGHDDLKVYIKQDTYEGLEKLASSDTSNELGSVLIGNFADEHNKIHVVISGFIEAKHTDATASTLTFTHETWEYIHAEQDSHYPDSKIIGWHHTHPNLGVFLSSYDLFIQENFFDLPFQIAYVIDPLKNERGFFQWKNGKIEELNGFYIYNDVGKKIISNAANDKTISKKTQNKTSVAVLTLIVIVAALSITLFFVMEYLISIIEHQQTIINERDTVVSELLDYINRVKNEGIFSAID